MASAPDNGAKPAGKSRQYPDEPRVGVGAVVFRPAPSGAGEPEVLLIKRGKQPNKGQWCFPGGSLELGKRLRGSCRCDCCCHLY